ncbi:MAG: hypothetical protein M3404_01570 [Actinomycetota bacterium]|nr:hypothetical protein [Actinomycetota bacterium]
MRPEWEERLARWLGGGQDLLAGAELEVAEPDGTVVFLAPLARHYRLEGDTLWVRPVVGGYEPSGDEPGLPPYAFSLNQARARALSMAGLRAEGDYLVLPQPSGQVARIRQARPTILAELERWDTFFYTVLSATEEAELDRLWGDSWWGQWA